MKKQEIIENINKHLAYNRELKDVCMHIFCYLINENPEDLKYITINNLKKAAEIESNIIYDAISYFTGERVSLLSVGYEYIDGDDVYTLSTSDIKELRTNKCFYHDGYAIENWESKIFIYFYASKLLKELK